MDRVRTLGRELGGRLVAATGADRLGRRQTWLALVFHHLTDETQFSASDPRTKGLGVDMSLADFERTIDHLDNRYEISTLDDAIANKPSAKRRLVICFDDAYGSVPRLAAPILQARGLPWIFFVNPGLVDTDAVALDNQLAYVNNVFGLERLQAIVGEPAESLGAVIGEVLPRLSYQDRGALEKRLHEAIASRTQEYDLRGDLYMTKAELDDLVASGVEIGNHTKFHVHCRTLQGDEIGAEVVDSANQLRSMVETPVRTFAYPYGSRCDVVEPVRQALTDSDHRYSFVVQGRLNTARTSKEALYRVSLSSATPGGITFQTEVLPRLRAAFATLAPDRGCCG